MRRLLPCALVALSVLCAPAAAGAQGGPRTLGSDLAANKPVNQNLGCRFRPNIGVIGGFIDTQPLNPQNTCTWWAAPLTAASTYVPVIGQGTITSARVRSGANPAPLQITILSSGGGLCCTVQRHSPTFQPAPNAISEMPLNLPAEAGLDPNRAGSQFTDIVAVSAVGPGDIPVFDYGPNTHADLSASGVPASSFLHPQLAPGQSNTDVGYSSGWETLLNVTWTPNGAATPGTGGGGGGGTGGGGGSSGGGGTGGGGGGNTGGGPVVPTVMVPAVSALSFSGRTLQMEVNGPSRIDAVIARKSGRKFKTVKKLRKNAIGAGKVKIAIPRSVKKGTYRVTVTATDAAGVRSAKVVMTIKVKR